MTASLTAIAAIVSIDSRKAPYNQVAPAQGVGASDIPEVRQAGMLGLLGMYRIPKGITLLQNRSIAKVIWNDDSTEKTTIVCQSRTPCVHPIPGSLTRGGYGGGGGDLSPGCIGNCGVVTVGQP
ncbi:hypothetical protein K8O61_03335 [Xanthomonas cerealis pv. cerealis]|uniref:hypothetical protein n=1 Tax=Xanthomonas cerealis TaxID=3390025 RepID=UPI001F2C53DB|nr:hypothetical protein [Xanthomonas translucens]UKE70110.1 hypothetical protein K8O61_03335 [Xanthomonas translucens pv. pistacia]